MKKFLAIIGLCVFMSCSKDSDTQSTGSVDYSGNYKGNISVTVNGSPSTGLTDYTIGVTQTGSLVTLSNNVFAASSGTITNSTLNLTKGFVAASPTYDLAQYGTATFTSTTMTIDFHEDQVSSSSGAVIGTKVWSGVLVKQ